MVLGSELLFQKVQMADNTKYLWGTESQVVRCTHGMFNRFYCDSKYIGCNVVHSEPCIYKTHQQQERRRNLADFLIL